MRASDEIGATHERGKHPEIWILPSHPRVTSTHKGYTDYLLVSLEFTFSEWQEPNPPSPLSQGGIIGNKASHLVPVMLKNEASALSEKIGQILPIVGMTGTWILTHRACTDYPIVGMTGTKSPSPPLSRGNYPPIVGMTGTNPLTGD